MSPVEKIGEWQRSVEGIRALDALELLSAVADDVRNYEHKHKVTVFEGWDDNYNTDRALGTLEAFIRARM